MTKFLSAIEARRQSALIYLTSFIEDAAKHNPPPRAFRCVCGVAGNPFDPEFEAIHQPHVLAAGQARLKQQQQRR